MKARTPQDLAAHQPRARIQDPPRQRSLHLQKHLVQETTRKQDPPETSRLIRLQPPLVKERTRKQEPHKTSWLISLQQPLMQERTRKQDPRRPCGSSAAGKVPPARVPRDDPHPNYAGALSLELTSSPAQDVQLKEHSPRMPLQQLLLN